MRSISVSVSMALVVLASSADAGKREMLQLTQKAIELPSNEQSEKIATYTAAIKEYDKFYLPWTNRAVCYLNYGRWDEAIADATRAIDLAPEDPHPYGVRGRAYAGKRLFEQAFRDLSRGLELADTEEDRRNLFNDRGNAYFSARRYDTAIQDYESALKIDPYFAQAHNNLGIALRSVGQLDKGVDSLRQAIRFDPLSARSLVNRGRLYVLRHDPVMAESDFDRAITLDGQDASAYLNRGMFVYAQGRPEDASADFARAIELEPQNPYVHIWRYLADASSNREAAQEALKSFAGAESSANVWPMPVIKCLLGEVAAEDVIKEAPIANDASRSAERLAEAHYYLAEAAHLAGDDAKAQEHLALAVEQGVPRSQEYVMAEIARNGWENPLPPPPRPVPVSDLSQAP